MNTALAVRRAEALRTYRDMGVPHRRVEDWKYTDLRAVLGDKPFEQGDVRWKLDELPANAELFDLKALDGGAPDWVMKYLDDVARSRNAMSAASFALARAGLALRIPRGVAATAPISLRFLGEGHVRALIVLEEGASVTLLETDAGAQAGMRNAGVELVIGAGARLTHVRTSAAQEAVVIGETAVSVARNGAYRGHFADFGAKLSRLELNIALAGEGAEAQLSGVTVVGEERHADVTTHIDHIAGHTQSRQLFKLVAGGHARAIYQGRITVHRGAVGTDSNQTAKGLLLGSRAEIDLKPELEILADDVKCAHGAAVGDLDAESLFYLRTRGIPETEARALLMRAFVEDAVAEIENDEIRSRVWQAIEAALAGVPETP